MISKKFILNADDFGLTKYNNQAVLEGYVNGFLRSASLCVNTEAFDNAVNDILPDCPELSIAVHLNIMEGKSLTNCPSITDSDGYFNKGYLFFILNSKNQKVLTEIRNEFKAQIEKAIKYNPDHLDSHVHTHAIPGIFRIVCELAKEYNIKYVRTQNEQLYFIPKISKHLTINYPINLIKIALLKYFTSINLKTLKSFDLKTNDNIIGVGYTGMMDSDAIQYGLEEIDESSVTEALIHPRKYETNKEDTHTKEFCITQDKTLQDSIIRMGFELTTYRNLD